MEFIDVMWRHDNQEYPVRLVSELDAQRYETRKLEFFSNGVVGFASASESFGGAGLGLVPVPPLSEINSDPEFVGTAITAAQFEALWAQHVKHT
jgi:uncharacterized protein DUF6881